MDLSRHHYLDHEQRAMVINGNLVHPIEASSPETADYTRYGRERGRDR